MGRRAILALLLLLGLLWSARPSLGQGPSGRITSPADGRTVGRGIIGFTAEAWEDSGAGVKEVAFLVFYDGAWHDVGVDETSPYATTWETPPGLRSQTLKFGVHVVDNAGDRTEYAGGVHRVRFIESLGNPRVEENWVPARFYLSQRALAPDGDVKPAAASMAMVLAMNGLTGSDFPALAARANEMHPRVTVGGTAYVNMMRDELRRQGATADSHNDVVDAAWARVRQEVDAGRPVIVRALPGALTAVSHLLVAVGYRETLAERHVIAYDPFGRWLGACCSDNYDGNGAGPESHKGQWAFYEFDALYGAQNWLITTRASAPARIARADIPGTPPDEVSDEAQAVVTYGGVEVEAEIKLFLPLVGNDP